MNDPFYIASIHLIDALEHFTDVHNYKSGYASVKSKVFNFDLKEVIEIMSRRAAGRLFHREGPAKLNARS